jgi:hypothetical protein
LKAGSEKCSMCGTPGGRPAPLPMKAIAYLPDFTEPAVVEVLKPNMNTPRSARLKIAVLCVVIILVIVLGMRIML